MATELERRLMVVDSNLVDVRADHANLAKRMGSLVRVRSSLEAERREILVAMKEGGPSGQDLIDLADAADEAEEVLSHADRVVAVQRDNAESARVEFLRSVSGGRYGDCEDEAAARRLAADLKIL